MAGLFSYVHTTLGNIACAVEKGYIPVVDMKSSPNTYLEPFQVGEKNAWELYFKQPLNYSLEDVYKCGNYIISPKKAPARYPGSRGALGMKDKEECDFWSILYKKFIILNENTNKYIDGEYNKLIKSNMRVLGVLCRGTDYTQMKPYGHQIQPQVRDIIKKVREVMKEWQCDYIYLATDEKKTLNIFEENFPDKIITNDRRYYDDFEFDKQLITLISFDRENDKYLQGLEYLSSIVILSRCNCLVSGLCGGSYAAIYMNGGKYEHKYLFDLGLYGINDKTTATDMI